jgi:trimeric autotransporter adhesin
MPDAADNVVMWPESPYALADAQLCPACFATLTSMTCGACGLVLDDPRAPQLLSLGRRMLELESERQRVIDTIRIAHMPPPVLTPTEPEPVSAEPVMAVPRTEPMTPEPPAPEAPASLSPTPRPRRRLSVPVLLLIVGVSLVGVAAVFFLVYAWFVAGIAVRALIIGAITLATIAIASLLRRRSLTATAEGIAALGVVLLALDAWAARANDMFGTGSIRPALYAGAAALVVGVLCRLWSRLSRLRVPDLAAVLALPAGLGLLVAGLMPLENAPAIVAGLLGASAGGLAHALPAPWSAARSREESVPERTALAIVGVAALVGAAGVAAFTGIPGYLAPGDIFVPLWSGACLIVLGIAHVLLLRPAHGAEPLPSAGVLAGVAAAIAALVAAGLGWQLAARSERTIFSAFLAPVIAVLVAVALDRARAAVRTRRQARSRAGAFMPPLTVAAIAAGAVGAVSTAWLLAASVANTVGGINATWQLWHTDVFVWSASDSALLNAVAALIIAVVIFSSPTLAARASVAALRPSVAAALVLFGAAGTGSPALIVGAALLVATVSLLALARGSSLPAWGASAAMAAVAAYAAGLAAPVLWVLGVLIALAVPILARLVTRVDGSFAVVLALAPVAVGVVTAVVAPSALSAVTGAAVDVHASFALVQWVVLIALLCAVVLRLDSPSRQVLAGTSLALLSVSFLSFLAVPVGVQLGGASTTVSAIIGEPWLAVGRFGALLVLLLTIAIGRTRVVAGLAIAAAAAAAPVAAAAVTSILDALRVTEAGVVPLAAMGAALAIVVAGVSTLVFPGAVRSAPDQARSSARFPVQVRRAADIGAAATALAVAWAVPVDLRWLMLLLVAGGFAATSVTHGWAAQARLDGVGGFQTRRPGSPLAAAPRRLLAWPAFAAATLALWSWLDDLLDRPIEAFAIPPAVGLLAFAVALVPLRRTTEATIAAVLAVTLGLVAPAIAGWSGTPVRGTAVAIVATVVALTPAWTPLRRVRVPALSASATALFALGLVAVDRAINGAIGSAIHEMADGAGKALWLALLVAAAFVSAWGFVRGVPVRIERTAVIQRRPPAPAAASAPAEATATGAVRHGLVNASRPGVITTTWLTAEGVFAALVPSLAVAAATVALIAPATTEPAVSTVAVTVLGLVHLAAARLNRLPIAGTVRWASLAAAMVIAADAMLSGAIDAVEVVSLPVALMLLGGAVLAMLRRRATQNPWPAGEGVVWLFGLGVALAPSIFSPATDVRAWLVVTFALVGATLLMVPRLSGAERLQALSVVVLSAGAVLMGLRVLLDPAVAAGESAATLAGVGSVAIAALMIWRADAGTAATLRAEASRPIAPLLVASIGAALVVIVTLTSSDGELIRSAVTLVLGGVVGLGGAWLLRAKRWAGFGAVIAISGVLVAWIAAGARFGTVADPAVWGIEPDLWAACAIGVLVAVGALALRSSCAPLTAGLVGGGFALAVALFAVAEGSLLGWSESNQVRTVLTVVILTVTGVVGVIERERIGLALAITSAFAVTGFGTVALVIFEVRPVELVTVPVALGLLALGARRLRRHATARTWPTLGPGLALLLIPSLSFDFGATALWRIVALGVVTIALVLIGAVYRLQAPLVLGSAVLLVHGTAQLWPWVSNSYVAVPWWLWLGIGGAILIFVAASYEKRVRQLKAAVTSVTSLR